MYCDFSNLSFSFSVLSPLIKVRPHFQVFHLQSLSIIDHAYLPFLRLDKINPSLLIGTEKSLWKVQPKLWFFLSVLLSLTFEETKFKRLRFSVGHKKRYNGFASVDFVFDAHFIQSIWRPCKSVGLYKVVGSISKTRSQNTRKWNKNREINPSFSGLTLKTSRHFASPPHVLYVKPSNKVYLFLRFEFNWTSVPQRAMLFLHRSWCNDCESNLFEQQSNCGSREWLQFSWCV